MNRAWLLIAGVCSMGCDRIIASAAFADAAPQASPPAATQTITSAAPPADAPSFLTRFCDAVAAGDKAYVTGHADAAFTSQQGPDPERPAGRKRTLGGLHHAADFADVCTRVRAQPTGEIARRVREEDGVLLVRLRNGTMASDLVIERRGADFRLVREESPRAAKAVRGTGGGGGGGGGW
jgi:hypothetical protein